MLSADGITGPSTLSFTLSKASTQQYGNMKYHAPSFYIWIMYIWHVRWHTVCVQRITCDTTVITSTAKQTAD